MGSPVTFEMLAWIVGGCAVGFAAVFGWVVAHVFGKLDKGIETFARQMKELSDAFASHANATERKLGQRIAQVEAQDRKSSEDNLRSIHEIGSQLSNYQLHAANTYATIGYLKDVETRLKESIDGLRGDFRAGLADLKDDMKARASARAAAGE